MVSVLIPAYNQEKYISAAIKSVLSQTYNYLQIIIGDDCSSDNTYNVIQELAKKDNRVIHYSNENNLGICANFNKLFDKAKGEYIVFFSGDDIMYPEKIELQLKCFETNNKLVLVHHNATMINENNEVFGTHLNSQLPIIDPLDYSLKVDFFHFHKFAFFMPTTCMAKADYFLHSRYNEQLKYKHELLFYLENYKAFPQGQWGYINKPLIQYRNHPDNFTNNPEFSKFLNAEKFKLAEIASITCPSLRKRIRRYLSFICYDIKLFHFYETKGEKEKINGLFNSNAAFIQKLYFLKACILRRMGLYWWNSKLIFNLLYKPFYLLKYKFITKRIF